jgi:hypothetical protein
MVASAFLRESDMTMKPRNRLRRVAGQCAISALGAMLAGACSEKPRAESETHFLAECSPGCGSRLTCTCGVCTTPCTSSAVCSALHANASCESLPASCEDRGRACDIECTEDSQCDAHGDSFACVEGRCRHADLRTGGSDGSLTPVDDGATSALDGSLEDASQIVERDAELRDAALADSAAVHDAMSASDATASADTGAGEAGSCSEVGAACCDPFPRDGANYCLRGLACIAGACQVDCGCVRGAFIPVCGVDGKTYDSTCGRSCVPVAIACDGQCPCQCTPESGTGCWSATPDAGTPCCGGLQCCGGVPYAAGGECHAQCNLVSDRAVKMEIEPADTGAMLQSVVALPIHTWSYRSQPAVKHIGPMAQDFAAGFGFGDSDRMIAAVDANGVALASIQALHAQLVLLMRRNAALERRVRELEERAGKRSERRR